VDNPQANVSSFLKGGWFRTGDLGFVVYSQKGESRVVRQRSSRQPWLTLTGRVKELVNRGGEKVSPYEVEEACMSGSMVQLAVCFPMPDETYGEQVAVVLLPAGSEHPGSGRKSSQDLAYDVLALCRKSLLPFQVPTTVFVLDSDALLPKTSTGKIQRTAMHGKLKAAGIVPVLCASQVRR